MPVFIKHKVAVLLSNLPLLAYSQAITLTVNVDDCDGPAAGISDMPKYGHRL